MMKKHLCILFSLLLISACLQVGCVSNGQSMIVSSGAYSESTPQQSAPAPVSSSSETRATPELPDLNEYPLAGIPAPIPLPEQEWEARPLEYKIFDAPDIFWENMEAMSEDDYLALWDRYNFYKIGECTLFAIGEGDMGASRIVVDCPNGTVSTLFFSTQTVMDIGFADRGKLIISLIEEPSPIGAVCRYYELDLKAKTLEPLPIRPSSNIYGYVNILYHSNYYLIKLTEESNFTVNNLYLETAPDKLQLLVENVGNVFFTQGRVYYWGEGDTKLYSLALDGGDKRFEYTLSPTDVRYAFWGERVYNGFFQLTSSSSLLNLNTKEYVPLSGTAICYFVDDGYYFYDRFTGNLLNYVSYEGKEAEILGNFTPAGGYAVVNGWVYFSSFYDGGDENMSFILYWKIRLNGTDLTLISGYE